jgi:xylulokinase
VILTFDLGTSATKAVVWDLNGGPLGVGVAEVPTRRAQPGWAEQDPSDWWTSLLSAAAAARSEAGVAAWAAVEALGFSAARETFVPVGADGEPLGPGIVWSDRRAAEEVEGVCADRGGREQWWRLTGVIVDAGAMVAKIGWLARNQPDVFMASRWLVAPRDLLVRRLTGEMVTDPTVASRTGCYGLDGSVLLHGDRLAPVVPSASVAGGLLPVAASALGLPPGLPVVVGAGDRACEVLGVGAEPARPMVSWGTTANISVPSVASSRRAPAHVSVSVGALAGYLYECGLSAAGDGLAWLAGLSGHSMAQLWDAAAAAPVGANGLVATSWFNGARAPWWEPGGRAAVTGLTAFHGPGDLARALIESVAFEVTRSLEGLGCGEARLCAAGGGGAGPVWPSILAGVTGRTVVRRRRPDLSASVGAAAVIAAALGHRFDLDAVNPPADEIEPLGEVVQVYRQLRATSDRVARAVLSLGEPGAPST